MYLHEYSRLLAQHKNTHTIEYYNLNCTIQYQYKSQLQPNFKLTKKRIQKSGHFYRDQNKRHKAEDESNKDALSNLFKKMEAGSSSADTNKIEDETMTENPINEI